MANPNYYGSGSNDRHPSSNQPNYRWWIPSDGIRRDVIQADIQRYLGPEALVRPGEGRDADRVRDKPSLNRQSLTSVQRAGPAIGLLPIGR